MAEQRSVPAEVCASLESESAAAVGDELDSIQSKLREFESGSTSAPGYGAFKAEWHRLDARSGKIDRVATTRQRSIIRQRREFTIPSSAPDIPTDLYHEFDDDYPLLSLCVDTVGYNYVKIFDTPGCRNTSRDYSRQYESQKRVNRDTSEWERGLAGR